MFVYMSNLVESRNTLIKVEGGHVERIFMFEAGCLTCSLSHVSGTADGR